MPKLILFFLLSLFLIFTSCIHSQKEPELTEVEKTKSLVKVIIKQIAEKDSIRIKDKGVHFPFKRVYIDELKLDTNMRRRIRYTLENDTHFSKSETDSICGTKTFPRMKLSSHDFPGLFLLSADSIHEWYKLTANSDEYWKVINAFLHSENGYVQLTYPIFLRRKNLALVSSVFMENMSEHGEIHLYRFEENEWKLITCLDSYYSCFITWGKLPGWKRDRLLPALLPKSRKTITGFQGCESACVNPISWSW